MKLNNGNLHYFSLGRFFSLEQKITWLDQSWIGLIDAKTRWYLTSTHSQNKQEVISIKKFIFYLLINISLLRAVTKNFIIYNLRYNGIFKWLCRNNSHWQMMKYFNRTITLNEIMCIIEFEQRVSSINSWLLLASDEITLWLNSIYFTRPRNSINYANKILTAQYCI